MTPSPEAPGPRVVHVINNLRTGGAEMLLGRLLPRLKELGADVSVAVLEDVPSPVREMLKSRGIEVFGTGAASPGSPSNPARLGRLLSGLDPGIVHVHLFPSLYWAALSGSGAALVYTEHSTWNRRRAYPFLGILEGLIYRRYSKVICISNGVKESLLKAHPGLKSRVTVLYNGIDTAEFRNAIPLPRERIHPSLGPGHRIMVMTASFTGKKDHATVIRALAMLPDAFVLLLPGDGPGRAGMMKLAADLGLRDRVFFPGLRTDIPELIRAGDYAVQSSRFEGFGLAALEAMAAGVPLLASRIPGLSEVAEGAGTLVEPGDPRALAEAVMELENDPEKRETLRLAAMEKAFGFDTDTMARKLMEIYGELTPRPGG